MEDLENVVISENTDNTESNENVEMGNVEKVLWQDRKRTIFGLPLSFTRYKLTQEKLYITTGFFNIKEEEVRLYRIIDMTLNCSLFQRMFNVGTIHFYSIDNSSAEFDVASIKNPRQTKELFSKVIEQERVKKKVASREVLIRH